MKLSREAVEAAIQATLNWDSNYRCEIHWFWGHGNYPVDFASNCVPSEHSSFGCPAYAAAVVDRISCLGAFDGLQDLVYDYTVLIDEGRVQEVVSRLKAYINTEETKDA